MVHDAADVPAGPGNLDSVRVRFDEEQLISHAGLLVTATLAERLGTEELVTESVWLGHKVPGASLPRRKVMSLVHGMLADADRIDQMDVLRAGSTSLVLGHRAMAPSTLGTFLRAFTFGHVRQLDRVLYVALTRAWRAGAGPGDGPLVIDIDSFHRRGPLRPQAGRQLRIHQEARLPPDPRGPLRYRRGAHIRIRKGNHGRDAQAGERAL